MTVKFSHLKNGIVAILLVVLGSVIGFRYGTTGDLPLGLKVPFQSVISNNTALSQLVGETNPSKANQKVNFDVFWEAWSVLENSYLDKEKIVAKDMVDGAISGMVSSLDDPYTIYLPPSDNKRSGEDLAGSFFGIGIELGYIEGVLAVVAPLKGTPAEKAGLQAQDLILRVKDKQADLDEDTANWSLNEAVDKIRGPKNSTVTLTILRRNNGSEPFDIDVTRGEIIVESVELEFVEHAGKRVAHISISRFGDRTLEEWNEVVRQILAQQNRVDGIVLDMRNNPGGFFDRSIDVASDFIKKGVIVTQKGKYSSQDFNTQGKARLADFPLIVLVNRGSASASEIVAGALRDDLDAKLVGEKTFGKGTVQDRTELSNGGGMHITVGRWLLPKGSWIHDEGLEVDVEVKDDPETPDVDEMLNKAIEELR